MKSKANDVYHELVIDLTSNCGLDMFTARKVVNFLTQQGHVDYDALKEYYIEDDS